MLVKKFQEWVGKLAHLTHVAVKKVENRFLASSEWIGWDNSEAAVSKEAQTEPPDQEIDEKSSLKPRSV